MKKIIFVRHAKSSWKYDVSDSERPLKRRGIIDVSNVSKEFKMNNIDIDAVYSSYAKRALETCTIFLDTLEISTGTIETSENLYDFSGNQVVSFIKQLNNSLETVLIFGHNHAFTSIVNTFGSLFIDNVPTSGLVMIEFNIESWLDFKKGITTLVLFPKDLKANQY